MHGRNWPVFADASGRRRRVLRRLGLMLAGLMVLFLGAIVVAMAGGPQAPLVQWAAPPHHAASAAGPSPASQRKPQPHVVAQGIPSPQPSPQPSAHATSGTPRPRHTNPGGHQPYGRNKSPNPRKHSHG
jgi:hypothetical protein